MTGPGGEPAFIVIFDQCKTLAEDSSTGPSTPVRVASAEPHSQDHKPFFKRSCNCPDEAVTRRQVFTALCLCVSVRCDRFTSQFLIPNIPLVLRQGSAPGLSVVRKMLLSVSPMNLEARDDLRISDAEN
jgi:hypothetical protein